MFSFNRIAPNSPKTITIASYLKQMAENGDSLTQQNVFVTPFHLITRPEISLDMYFLIITQQMGLEDEQSLAVLIFISRFTQNSYDKGTPFLLNSLTSHR